MRLLRRRSARPIQPPPILGKIIDADDGLPEVVTSIDSAGNVGTQPLGEYIAARWRPDLKSGLTLAEILINEGWQP